MPDEPETPTRERVERIRSVGSEEVVEHHSPTPPEHELIRVVNSRENPWGAPLQSNPTISIADIRTRRFYIIEHDVLPPLATVPPGLNPDGSLRLGQPQSLRHFGGDISLHEGSPDYGGNLVVFSGQGEVSDSVRSPEYYASEAWWKNNQMPGAVFQLIRKPKTLPEARSAFLRVLERRAETAPPTWGERLMQDEDDDDALP
jgi:hypothetical protein